MKLVVVYRDDLALKFLPYAIALFGSLNEIPPKLSADILHRWRRPAISEAPRHILAHPLLAWLLHMVRHIHLRFASKQKAPDDLIDQGFGILQSQSRPNMGVC